MAGERREWMPLVAAAIAVLILAVIYVMTRSISPEDPANSPEALAPGTAVPEAPPDTTPKDASRLGEGRAATPKAGRGGTSDVGATAQPTDVVEIPGTEPSLEFFPEDRELCGKGVSLGLGDYHVSVGEEFTVEVSLEAEDMESFLLVLEYDPKLLAIVPDSAEAVGRVFRRGIEFNYKQDRGLVAIIHRGTPGQRNLLKANGETAVSFKMTALTEGETKLTVPPKGADSARQRGRWETKKDY